ncbi:hypothetical protein [Lunatimonas salinarum]|uniref:hypothetical protein n=1 Tax=Lunatimonas salinarum TaxID=1774590 RepID=UPI001AE06C97|nr:hypothetical protein [Lunatimonas salinarum]
MKRFFIYPLNQGKKGSPNPYVDKLASGIGQHGAVVNRHAKHRGVLSLFIFLFRSDVFILNWVESFPTRKFGVLQSLAFMLFLKVAGILKRQIIWVLHNKGSHHGGSKYWVNALFNRLMTDADQIVTHSNEGRVFVKTHYPKALGKVQVIPHPIEPPFAVPSNEPEKKHDILIWGSLFPYKGVDLFLEYLDNHGVDDLQVLVVGKCPNPDYKARLVGFMNSKRQYRDELLGLEELAKLAQESKYVLFTYKAETILSSGALMDTLRMNCRILGPRYGAFKDLSCLDVLQVYDDFSEVVLACRSFKVPTKVELDQVSKFCEQNSWEGFAKKLVGLV